MIGDYPLQGEFLANNKSKYNYILFCHAVIWTGCIVFGLWFIGMFAWWKFIMLLVGHFIIDWVKCHQIDKNKTLTKDLWIDQGLHFIQLILCLI